MSKVDSPTMKMMWEAPPTKKREIVENVAIWAAGEIHDSGQGGSELDSRDRLQTSCVENPREALVTNRLVPKMNKILPMNPAHPGRIFAVWKRGAIAGRFHPPLQ